MSAFRPNKKAFIAEERILSDRLYLQERPVLIDFLARLRAATNPGDYFALQLDLFRRVKGHQDQIDRIYKARPRKAARPREGARGG